MQSLMDPVTLEDPIDDTIDRLRTQKQHEGHLALPGLVWASLDHASMAISYPDDTLGKVMETTIESCCQQRCQHWRALVGSSIRA